MARMTVAAAGEERTTVDTPTHIPATGWYTSDAINPRATQHHTVNSRLHPTGNGSSATIVITVGLMVLIGKLKEKRVLAVLNREF